MTSVTILQSHSLVSLFQVQVIDITRFIVHIFHTFFSIVPRKLWKFCIYSSTEFFAPTLVHAGVCKCMYRIHIIGYVRSWSDDMFGLKCWQWETVFQGEPPSSGLVMKASVTVPPVSPPSSPLGLPAANCRQEWKKDTFPLAIASLFSSVSMGEYGMTCQCECF